MKSVWGFDPDEVRERNACFGLSLTGKNPGIALKISEVPGFPWGLPQSCTNSAGCFDCRDSGAAKGRDRIERDRHVLQTFRNASRVPE